MEKANSRYNILASLKSISTMILISFPFHFCFMISFFTFEHRDIHSLRLVEESVSDKARIKWWVGSWSQDSHLTMMIMIRNRYGFVCYCCKCRHRVLLIVSLLTITINSSLPPHHPPHPAWRCLQASLSRGVRSFKEPWRRHEAKRG